jgi:glycosyltransferase involved in cell wall biosynthesis
MSDQRRVELLYLACNRLEFTRESFMTLLANTDWSAVQRLVVGDDGSRDGTRAWLQEAARAASVPVTFQWTQHGSPVAAMAQFIAQAHAPILAKIDNDVMLPPGWLAACLGVLDRHPELALLGIEALYPVDEAPACVRGYTPAPFVSGLGLYRREAFAGSLPAAHDRWFGFEEWQQAQGDRLGRGWLTPALPIFLLDRTPLEPWRTLTRDYVRRGWQRPWPAYDLAATLWRWRWPDGSPAARAATDLPAGDTRFLGALRIKDEARHIHEVVSHLLPLCHQVYIFDDHSTDGTVEICRAFGDRVVLFASPFTGLDEARDKNFLLQKLIQAAPEWVLWIDGDEVLERSGPEKLRLAAQQGRTVAACYLQIAYLWDDPQQVRVDGIYGQFRRLSFFRLRGQPSSRLYFPASGYGGNFHCGNVPRGLVGAQRSLNVRLKHYGYMTAAQRAHKYAWYNAMDPNNPQEDYYRHLAGISGARYAPGPPQIVPWVE